MTAPMRSSRLYLDEPDERDLDALVDYCSDPEILRWIPLPDPFERAHAEYLVRTLLPEGKTHGTRAEWAIRLEPDAPLIGVVEVLFQPVNSGEIGFWLGEKHRGNGYMTEALAAVADHLLAPDGRGLTRLHWEAMVGNDASARVARRIGFRFEGTGRQSIVFRGVRRDAWQASLLADDARQPQPGWPVPD
jgi:RimJ/RimL family protein N-acetyltransferase